MGAVTKNIEEYYPNDNFKIIHNDLYNLLDVFSKFCSDMSINYSLIAGSVIGAVVWGGIIPWDDDIDVIVSRESFETMKHAWNRSERNGAEFVYEDGILFGKIKLGNVWIDILPMDYVPKKRKKHLFWLLVTSFTNNKKKIKVSPKLWRNIVFCLFKLPFLIIPNRFCKKMLLRSLANTDRKFVTSAVVFNDYYNMHWVLPVDWEKNVHKVKFGTTTAMMVNDYHNFTIRKYPNYMDIPDAKKRVTKH